MAKIDVKATITAPSEITIPLIRADHAAHANVFRVCFEIFLSITSTLFGYVLSLAIPQPIHWIALSISGVATLCFLGVSAWVNYRCRNPAKGTPE